MGFGEIVKDIRLKLELTQVQFAKKLGVTPIMISYYELGRRTTPSISVAKKLVTIAHRLKSDISLEDIYQ